MQVIQRSDSLPMDDAFSAHRPLPSRTDLTESEGGAVKLALLAWTIALVMVVLGVVVLTHGAQEGVGPFASLGR